jgi:hypothetical protein
LGRKSFWAIGRLNLIRNTSESGRSVTYSKEYGLSYWAQFKLRKPSFSQCQYELKIFTIKETHKLETSLAV